MVTLEAVKKLVTVHELDTVLVCFPDMQGRLMGKRMHAGFFLDGGHEETHACDYLLANDIDMEPVPGYAAANWARGYGDFVMKPDLETMCLTPWLQGTALVLCDILDHHDRKLVPHAPRSVLKRQIERVQVADMMVCVASELEFYLFDEDYRTLRERAYRNPKSTGYYIEDYHIFQTSKEEAVMRAMRNGLRAAGIPVESSKGEWGPGQEEINVHYADALTMADRHVIMKNGMKEIAHQHGKAITFMAKSDFNLAGSSCHIHMSLWDKDGKIGLFHDPSDPLGMSKTMRAFTAGQLKYAPDITLFLAPYINSYKRFRSGTFAPTKLVWSRDNRTAAFRLCGEGTSAIRTECRIGGADLNPYLAFAALLAAGMRGIEEGLEPPEPFSGDAYSRRDLPDIPSTLRDAVRAFNASMMLRDAFGDAVVDHYVHNANWEQFEYDRRVTDWELQRGFERS